MRNKIPTTTTTLYPSEQRAIPRILCLDLIRTFDQSILTMMPISNIGLDQTLRLPKCPYCSVDIPHLYMVWGPIQSTSDQGTNHRNWAGYFCKRCGGCVIASAMPSYGNKVVEYYPQGQSVDLAIPNRARNFLIQAIDSLHSPSASLMVCASSVDAMLKAKGYKDGKLFTRINKAKEDHLITDEMASWFHHVRLEANDERHPDNDDPDATPEDAVKSIEFAKALGEFLFVLPARIQEGITPSSSK